MFSYLLGVPLLIVTWSSSRRVGADVSRQLALALQGGQILRHRKPQFVTYFDWGSKERQAEQVKAVVGVYQMQLP